MLSNCILDVSLCYIPCIQMNHESCYCLTTRDLVLFCCFVSTEPLCAKVRAQCLIKICRLSKRKKERNYFQNLKLSVFYSRLASKRKSQGLRQLLGYSISRPLLFALISAISTQSTNPTSKSFISSISKMEENYSEIN